MKCLGKKFNIIKCRYWFDAGNNRNGYPNLPALIPEPAESVIIEKHLCYNITRSCIDLPFQVLHVYKSVCSFKMFLGVSCYSYAKIGRIGIFKIIFKIFALIHINYLLNELKCISMPILLRNKYPASFLRITP